MANNLLRSVSDKLVGRSSAVGANLSKTAMQYKERASELGRKAAYGIEENLSSAASGLDRAATTLHGEAGRLLHVDSVSNLAHAAAGKVNASADYVRDTGVSGIVSDAKKLVRSNPVPSLVAVGAIAFMIGRAFGSRDAD